MSSIVAIDIGGTTIKSCAVEIPPSLDRMQLQPIRRTPTPVGSVTALLGEVSEIIHSYGSDVAAVGLVMPGVLDVPNGRVRMSSNLHIVDEPIVAPLQSAIRLPVYFDHDVRAGATAELLTGAARGFRDAAFMPIGTGIAAAFIIDGAIRNADGYMGEVGHAYVGPELECVCGLTGCLEAVASASGIMRHYSMLTGLELDAPEILRRTARAEPTALRVWDAALAGLVRACAMIANLLGSEAIIVGGGLAQAGDALFQPLRDGLASALCVQRVPQVIPAAHGKDAGCLGAALIVLREMGLQ